MESFVSRSELDGLDLLNSERNGKNGSLIELLKIDDILSELGVEGRKMSFYFCGSKEVEVEELLHGQLLSFLICSAGHEVDDGDLILHKVTLSSSSDISEVLLQIFELSDVH